MENARLNHNLVVMPTGHILAVGGTDPEENPVLEAEWFDPEEQFPEWDRLAFHEFKRAYHSTAVLLPDATVLVAGDQDVLPPSGEIFTPPYLIAPGGGSADQPKILFAPGVVQYGQDFTVKLDLSGFQAVSAGEIDEVNLVRLAAVTHSFDQNQRFVPLDFVVVPPPVFPGDPSLRVTPPSDPNVAPRGYYMLFLVSDDGVPSDARYVQLTGTPVSGP